ncbi:hypothetical protein D1AOALGA4SA_12082 [Olavius algarvensis Delta 1 endosymbiont]|nr:hypothetical protein D1AOALGA4SA_12082 [Olavius algarvensis Delta 1 endosymbiont]
MLSTAVGQSGSDFGRPLSSRIASVRLFHESILNMDLNFFTHI